MNEGLSYAGIAKHYRDILETDKKIVKNTPKSSLSLSVIGAIDVDSHFLGIPCRRLKPLTTYGQLTDIITDLNEHGVEDIAINYIGWNNNGIQNKKMNANFKPLAKLGGKKAFDNLVSLSKEKNVELFFDADMQSFTSNGNGVTKLKNAIKTMFDKYALQRKFSYATFEYEKNGYMLVDLNGFSRIFNKYIKSVNSYDATVGLSFNSMSSKLYSDFDNNRPTTKTEMLNEYEKSFNGVKQALAARDANSYMWKYANEIFETPAASSRQRIYDGEIPMYQMIIHGYIPYTIPAVNSNTNRKELFLRAIETGSNLAFTIMKENSAVVDGTDYDYLYATTYSEVVSDAVDMYEYCKELNALVAEESIVDYNFLKSGISKTVYSNGISVIVNYTDDDYLTDDGVTVPAKDFVYRR